MNGLLGASLVLAGSLATALVGVVLLLVARTTHARELAKRLADVHAQTNAELSRTRAQLARFQPLVDADTELARVRCESATLSHQVETTRQSAQAEIQALQATIFTLRQETGALQAEAFYQSYGLHGVKHELGDSAAHCQRLASIRDQQKQMTKDNQAATCKTEWGVGGTAIDGRRLAADYVKLMLRAFNGECDAAIVEVEPGTFAAAANRIRRSYEALNEIGAAHACQIMPAYLNLKIEELTLFHECQQMSKDEPRTAEVESEREPTNDPMSATA